MERLKFKDIHPYLPYDLECEILNYKCDYVGDKYGTILGYYLLGDDTYFNFKKGRDYAGKSLNDFKPILKSLSDITDEDIDDIMNESWIVSSDNPRIVKNDISVSIQLEDGSELDIWLNIPHCNMEWINEILYSKHYDLKSLIEKGLAINKNNL